MKESKKEKRKSRKKTWVVPTSLLEETTADVPVSVPIPVPVAPDHHSGISMAELRAKATAEWEHLQRQRPIATDEVKTPGR